MTAVPIDWANVNWVYVGVLAVFAFLATIVGNLLSFNHRGFGAVLSALIFAAIFVFWSYYPHHLPLPTRLVPRRWPPRRRRRRRHRRKPAAPSPPRNPVTDITPPR